MVERHGEITPGARGQALGVDLGDGVAELASDGVGVGGLHGGILAHLSSTVECEAEADLIDAHHLSEGSARFLAALLQP